MKTIKEITVQIGTNATRVRTHNKQVMVAANKLVNDAVLVEIAYCINAEEHKTVWYKKIRKNTFVNSISLKDETAIQLYACLKAYFDEKYYK